MTMVLLFCSYSRCNYSLGPNCPPQQQTTKMSIFEAAAKNGVVGGFPLLGQQQRLDMDSSEHDTVITVWSRRCRHRRWRLTWLDNATMFGLGMGMRSGSDA